MTVSRTSAAGKETNQNQARTDWLNEPERAFIQLAEQTADVAGPKFFDRLVQKCCEILGVSSAFVCQSIGATPTRVRIVSFFTQGDWVEPFEYDIAGTPCADVYANGEAFFSCDVQALFPEDTDLHDINAESYYGIALFDESGTIIGHLGILDEAPLVRDVVEFPAIRMMGQRAAAEIERGEIQERLRRTEFRMQQSQRLASIGTLSAGIAHEINNPLEAILLSAETAIELTHRGDNVDECLETIVASAERASEIVRGVLRFAKQQPAPKSRLPIGQVIKTAVDYCSLAAQKKRVVVILDCPRESPMVLGNSIELEQVFVNLLRNAIEASQGRANKVEINVDLLDGDVAVSIRDFGTGVCPEIQRQIFDPFYSTRNASGGTGLGLSISHGIVSAHDGRIELVNHSDEPGGRGTTFVVVLPQES